MLWDLVFKFAGGFVPTAPHGKPVMGNYLKKT